MGFRLFDPSMCDDVYSTMGNGSKIRVRTNNGDTIDCELCRKDGNVGSYYFIGIDSDRIISVGVVVKISY